MVEIASLAGMIGAATLTPGPNNLIVMRTAADRRIRGVRGQIAGIASGSLALLAVATFGAQALFTAVPGARLALSVAGCLYLAWLGLRLATACRDADVAATSTGPPARTPPPPRLPPRNPTKRSPQAPPVSSRSSSSTPRRGC